MRATLLLLCSCSFHGQSSLIDRDASATQLDVSSEGMADVMPDVTPLCETWIAQHFMPCAFVPAQPALDLAMAGSPYTYNTTTGGGVLKDRTGTAIFTSDLVLTQADQSMVAVMNVDGFTLEAQAVLRVIGTKPLLIASWSMLVVAGDLDAGSHMRETDAMKHLDTIVQHGAGANVACGPLAGLPGSIAVATGGSGGGGGGAFGGNGGGGAKGDDHAGPNGGAGGMKLAAPPTVIRGGCPGAASGKVGPSTGVIAPATSETLSIGGDGGGAIELAARISITIGGKLRAGGAAGAGAPQGSACGGGGGGAGGYIGLDAPAIAVTGFVAANGGGGGGSAPFVGFGNIGTDGQPTTTPASGGGAFVGGTCGEPGAAGGAGATTDGVTSTANDACGGGGGGGGTGEVLVWSPSFVQTAMTVSPAAVVTP